MTAPPGRRLLHLAAALDRQSAYDAASYVESARLAESGGLDFVTLDDGPARPGPAALAVLSQVAPATHRVGLVPTVTATHTEPGPVQAAVAALDRVSRGRAGWRLGAPAGPAAAEAARPRDGTEPGGTEGGGTEGDGAERDGAGRGAPVAPWSPQGHLVRVAEATGGHACGTAARHADVVLVNATHPAQAAAVRDRLRDEAARSGRDPGALRVLAGLAIDLRDGEYAAERGGEFPRSEHGREPGGGGGLRRTARGPLYRGGPVDLAELIAAWHREGAVDGFHLVPSDPRRDLERLVNGTVTLLQHRGLFRTFYPGGTLREHLGLARPVDRRTGRSGARRAGAEGAA